MPRFYGIQLVFVGLKQEMNAPYNTEKPKDSLVNFLSLRGIRRKKLFLAMSALTVPALTYIYTLPISLIAWAIINVYGLYFDTDKAELREDSRPQLREIASFLEDNQSIKVLVVGHTDNVGDLSYNQGLSERRAAAVVDELVADHGVNRQRLTPVGVGMAAPVASNLSESGRALNRRVELVRR